MGDIKGFLKVKRRAPEYRPVCERIKDFAEVTAPRTDQQSQEQASRCMDCGTPFCHWGCPIGNYIPEWNDLMFGKHWEKAFMLLQATNNLPEITARLCPAICEYACVLGINDEAVTIRENELSIIEHAFKAGLIKPFPPKKRTGRKIAIVGSGPAGLACADQLNKAGHKVVVFERDDKPGGILRYGIPDFKLEKWVIDRRIRILEEEGIKFATRVNVGIDYKVWQLKKEFDVICLAAGCRIPRDLKIEGRELRGIHFAMEYLVQSNKRLSGQAVPADKLIDAKGKKVAVIGGGDTGADCVGCAHRQGASCVMQIELLSKPPECRTQDYPWPRYPLLLKTSASHEEGGERFWSILTRKFIGENGSVKKLSCVRGDFSQRDSRGCPLMREIPGTEFEIEADMVILALGFVHPEKKGLMVRLRSPLTLSGVEGLITELGVEVDSRGNVKTDENFMTLAKGVFSAGDMRRGQSLVVWAIAEGRYAAHCIDKYLMGQTCLPGI